MSHGIRMLLFSFSGNGSLSDLDFWDEIHFIRDVGDSA